MMMMIIIVVVFICKVSSAYMALYRVSSRRQAPALKSLQSKKKWAQGERDVKGQRQGRWERCTKLVPVYQKRMDKVGCCEDQIVSNNTSAEARRRKERLIEAEGNVGREEGREYWLAEQSAKTPRFAAHFCIS